MKKIITNRINRPIGFLFLLLAVTALTANAQTPAAMAKADIKLTFERSEGTNGTSVTWNPVRKIYYAVIAGNTSYPLETFTEAGKPMGDTEAGFDFRSLWWNAKAGVLEGNGAGDWGVCKVNLDDKGRPDGTIEVLHEGEDVQPDFQSAGAYDAKKKQIVHWDAGELVFYSRKTFTETSRLKLDLNGEHAGGYNTTTVIYTGKKKSEFGLLDYDNGEVHFFNRKGVMTGKTTLTGSFEFNDMFRFSYANDRVWIYNIEDRTWTGFKVF